MRVTGLLLVLALAAGCRDGQQTQQADAPRPAPSGFPGADTRATGTAGENPNGLSKPSIGSPEAVNNSDAALIGFQKRVNSYAALHNELARGSAKQKETSDAGKIDRAEDALAVKVQAARSDAKQGDIFTADVRPIFRRLLAPELKGRDGAEARATLKDDAPPPNSIPFKVNGTYPDTQPLPTVPPGVLATLPRLPAPLEYRIVGRHLLLLDGSADLIVDYIPNAVAAGSQ